MILDHLTETIAAIATPLGVGGVAIVRISGTQACRIVRNATTIKELHPNTIRLVWVVCDEGTVIDEALVAWFSCPHSYTGEDVAEIQCHGGMVLARQILERVIALGARLAEPGEFTLRAFINGKIDLIKAESIIDLIEAKTEKASTIQAHHLEGDLSSAIRTLRQDVLSLIAHLEVHLDYPEEEPLAVSLQYREQMLHTEQSIDALLATFQTGRILQDGLLLVIVGKPNVGKSSLLNVLINENRVLVSDQPGTTRDAIEVWMKIMGVPIRVVDTAGMHETMDTIEKMGIERSVEYLEKADLVLFVVDQVTGITEQDQRILQTLPWSRTIGVVNKIDQAPYQAGCLPSDLLGQVGLSAKTQQGMSQLWNMMEQSIQAVVGHTVSSTPMLTNGRQKEQLIKAKSSILEAIQSLDQGLSADFWLIGLRSALRDLSEILGEDVSDEVLAAIFARFCIGK